MTTEVNLKVRDILGSFLFSNDEVTKKIKVLSGGERARVALCRLLLEPYNLLIMDEPTNHLDITSKELLKKALINFDGTLIVVSHDRDFLQGLSNKIYEFKDKGINEYMGELFVATDRIDEAKKSGAEIVGSDDLLQQISNGKFKQ